MCYSSCAIYYTLFNYTGDMQKIYVHLLYVIGVDDGTDSQDRDDYAKHVYN